MTMPIARTALSLLLLAGAALMAYGGTFHSPFVFDDINFITRNNPHVHMTTLSWDAVKEATLKAVPSHRHLPSLSFALNYYVGRENPFGYHLVNLIIHVLTGVALFFLFRLTLAQMVLMDPKHPPIGLEKDSFRHWAALSGALIWLLHPLETSAVTYLCQRMTSMAALFVVLSLLLFAHGRIAFQRGLGCRSKTLFMGCAAAGVCGVASKENAGMLPVLLVLYDWFFLKFPDKGQARPSWKTRTGPSLALLLFGLMVVYFLGLDPLARIAASYGARDYTLSIRLLTEARVVVYYLSLLAFPHPGRLVLDHDYPLSASLLTPVTTLTCLMALGALLLAALGPARKHNLTAFAVLWFLANLAIESSVIGIEIIYEHRMYLPGLFWCLAAAVLVFRLVSHPKARVVAVFVLCLILGWWTHERNKIWESDIAFWSDGVAKAPGKARPYQNLAYSLQLAGRHREAIVQYRKSLAISPHPTAFGNLGLCYEACGYYSDAAEAYAEALKIKPNAPDLHANLAAALTHMGEFEAALAQFDKARRLAPDHPGPKHSMAALRAFLNGCGDKGACLAEGIRQAPNNAELRFTLGKHLEERGDWEAAARAYETVRAMIGETDRKLYERVVIRRAALHAMRGEMEETRRILAKAIQTAPDNPVFYYEMAALFAGLSQVEQAASWLEKAFEKGFTDQGRIGEDPRFSSLRDTRRQGRLKIKD